MHCHMEFIQTEGVILDASVVEVVKGVLNPEFVSKCGDVNKGKGGEPNAREASGVGLGDNCSIYGHS